LTYLNPNSVQNLRITYNPLLSQCSILSICDILEINSINPAINFNGENCTSSQEIIENCFSSLNIVSGTVKFDFDSNSCDVNDYEASNLIIKATNANAQTISTTTDENGDYELRVPAGIFTFEINSESIPENFLANPNEQDYEFTTTGNQEILDFCIESQILMIQGKIS